MYNATESDDQVMKTSQGYYSVLSWSKNVTYIAIVALNLDSDIYLFTKVHLFTQVFTGSMVVGCGTVWERSVQRHFSQAVFVNKYIE